MCSKWLAEASGKWSYTQENCGVFMLCVNTDKFPRFQVLTAMLQAWIFTYKSDTFREQLIFSIQVFILVHRLSITNGRE